MTVTCDFVVATSISVRIKETWRIVKGEAVKPRA